MSSTTNSINVLSNTKLIQTADSIAAVQLESGMIPWFEGGHADAWNHTEAAMALTVAGLDNEANRAYQWLSDTQREDGSWFNYYIGNKVEDPNLDTNCICYVATGVWHHYLARGDTGFLETMWPVIQGAVNFVLGLQTERGEIIWARTSEDTPWDYALLAGSSSIHHSIGCAIEVASELGHEVPEWIHSQQLLGTLLRKRREVFEPKDRWALDWFYPVLSGALEVKDARARLVEGKATFIIEGEGVRCVKDQDWVTAAETCETVIALAGIGETEWANQLFGWAQQLRDDDGAYFTGRTVPDYTHFPGGERSTYTSAAAILASDALTHTSPTSSLFSTNEVAP